MASGALQAIHEKGFLVPADCCIVTYHNTAFSEGSHPPLDSIEVYLQENAKEAAFALMRLWSTQRMLLGVDYYPEQWDSELLEQDLDTIVELGCNVIRIGEFSWHMMET